MRDIVAFDLRLAAIVGPTVLWGAAFVHIYQMITAHNFAPGNAGIIFYSDVLLPVVGFIFLWLQHRPPRPDAAAPSGQVRGEARFVGFAFAADRC